MGKSRYRMRKAGKKNLSGRTKERCVHCNELTYIAWGGEEVYRSHTRCAWCKGPLCKSESFGVIWKDCEDGIIERRDRDTGKITRWNFRPHNCLLKRLAHLPTDSQWFGDPFWFIY